MKTATIPSLRVSPDLRRAAESLLLPDESLSGFVESALRAQIACRQSQQEFIARGLASSVAARESGEYYSASNVLNELDAMLNQVA